MKSSVDYAISILLLILCKFILIVVGMLNVTVESVD